eukprot:TRINITY_DN4917_c0_g1_i2.p1 TRINITY_DN4917_c0_g1~~TRINITY_DN4917_c0_g1_i2.p1  ORF type:complete len:250 (-),score=6.70 TRINITY_DN4917_c0_g1_i2:121-870(-)
MILLNYRIKRFSWTIVELVIFLISSYFLPTLTFTSYFTAKFIQSLITYLTGLNHGIDEQKTKSTFPDDKHDSYQVKPEVLPIRPNSTLEKFLEACGRCHQYAIITCYELSCDKFFGTALFLFLRFDVWYLLGFYIMDAFVCITLGVDIFGYGLDLMFMLITLVETWNLSSEQFEIHRIKRCNEGIGTTREIMKLLLLLLVWYLYVFYSPSLVWHFPVVQFFLLNAFIFFVTCCFRPYINLGIDQQKKKR